MNSVLVGIDGSEGSRTALRWAAAVAAGMGVPLRAVSAWQYPPDTTVSVGGIDLPSPREADERVEGQMRSLLTEELGEGADHVITQVARGPATGVLLRAAEQGTRMLVVGSRGLGGFRGLLLGSVSRQLVEHAPCPVVVVPRSVEVDPLGLETIVVGVDGSAHAARALTFAADVATALDAELIVANALGSGDVEPHGYLSGRREIVDEWCAPLRDGGVAYRLAVVAGDARTALPEVVGDRSADLLVVGSRGRGPVTKLVLGSVASAVVQDGQVPVAVVPRGR